MIDDFSPNDPPLQHAGQLLIAEPSLHGSVFSHAVILLTEDQPAAGSIGLILNHPTGNTVADLLPSPEFSALHAVPVHSGGPVADDKLIFASFWIGKNRDLRWSLSISAADAALQLQKPTRCVRAFIGHSGWAPGQLADELRRPTWITARPQPDLFHQAHDRSLWSQLLRTLSPYHRLLAETPVDPSLN